MIKIFLLTVIFAITVASQAFSQCRVFKLQYKWGNFDEKVYKMLVNDDSFSYIFTQNEQDKNIDNVNLVTPFNHYIWHYQISKNLLTVQRTLQKGEQLIANYTPDTLNWQLVEGEKTIIGYQCNKAILRQNDAVRLGYTVEGDGDIIVWYSPQIPVSAGPERLYGLPGLILEIRYSNFPNMSFVVISEETVDSDSSDCPQVPLGGLKVTKDEVRKVQHSKSDLKKYKEAAEKK